MSVPLAYVICLFAFSFAGFCAYKAVAALREPLDRDRIVREARARTGLADFAERLLNEIHNEQQNGDQP